MASIGRFGVVHDHSEGDTFDWFEHEVRVSPTFGQLDLADFLEAAASVSEDDIAKSMATLKGTFRAMVHEEDFDTFWATAKREGQTIGDLMSLMMAIVEMTAERPTVRPSGSSDGPPSTSADSVDDSSSRVIRRLELEGRPSLALMVRQAQGSRVSA